MSDSTVAYDPFRSGEIERTVPSTEPQREIISSALLGDQANIAFNEGISVHFPYAVDSQKLESALAETVRRHESLRTTFTRAGDELCVSAESGFELTLDDQTGLGDDEVERYVQSLWQEYAAAPMHLFDGPLFQATLVRLPNDHAELIIMAHHVICDGWSFYIILEDLVALLTGEQPAQTIDSFAEFAERQNAEQLSNRDIDYWLDQYRESVPELDLPADRPRPAERSFAAQRVDYELDADTVSAVKAMARANKASVVQVVFAGVAALLHRLTEDEDIAIGLPVARQSSDGLHAMVGHAVQLLPIRVTAINSDSFAELIARAKAGILDAQEHPNFTFGSLVRELGFSGDPSRVPIVPVIFNIDQPFGDIRAEGHALTIRSIPRLGENFEIFFNVMPQGDMLTIEATHNTDLFDGVTIRHWLEALQQILRTAAADSSVTLGALWRDVGRSETEQAGEVTDRDRPVWFEHFVTHVARDGAAPAAMDRTQTLTYQDLHQRALAIASTIVAHGVQRGDVVAHCVGRTVDLPAIVLGTQMAGATMLPLDPNFPVERLAFMLEDSAASLILTDGSLANELANDAHTIVDVAEATGSPPLESLPQVDQDTAAYLIYTSGSTGKPKGVLVGHDALENFLGSMANRPGFSSDDRLLAVTTASFDISLLELLLPLYSGGSVYVATREQATDARQLQTLIVDLDVTVLQATPATWRLLLAARWSGAPNLRALCGGEAMPHDVAQRLLPLVSELWNMYGPTETTIWSSCKKIESDFSTITVGQPIANTQFVIMDAAGNATPASVPGELCIGGSGLAAGYLGREQLTADRFVQSVTGARLYRTGDKARFLANGEVQFLGRFDDQVKVRGFRIELGDIENVLQQHESVESAAVYVWSVGSNDQRVVACCLPASGKTLQTHQLRKFLRGLLPDYMIPQHFLTIDAIPLSPSGKINRRALPRPVAVQSSIGEYTPPRNAAEKAIAEIWTALIQPERPVGCEARFFEIGGHSLLGLEAIFRIEQRLSVSLHPRILYTEDLADIARQCGDAAASTSSSRPVRLGDDAPRMLSFAQLDIASRVDEDGSDATLNLPACFMLTGKLDQARLAAAAAAVFERHEALTTLLSVSDNAPGGQSPTPTIEFVHDDAANAETIVVRVQSLARESTSLRDGPLAKLALVSNQSQVHFLVFVPHQFSFDGWSFDVFLRDLEAAYTAGGQLPPTPADALRYSDYATWQRSQTPDDETLDYWRNQVHNVTPLPQWDRPVGELENQVVAQHFELPLELVEKLEARAATQKTKLADVALAMFAETLSVSAGSDRITLDVATSGRYLPEVFSIIGLFYQDLPVTVAAGQGFDRTLSDAQMAMTSLGQFQNVAAMQVESLLGQPLYRSPVSFSYQQATERPTRFGDLAFDQVDVARVAMVRDLDFWIRRTPTGLFAQIDFRVDRVNQHAVEDLVQSLRSGLEAFAQGRSIELSAIEGLFEKPSNRQRGLLSRLFS